MKKLFVAFILAILVFEHFHTFHKKASDEYVREAVVQLRGAVGGGCTGVQIKASSGRKYVLTAAHCRVLVQEDGSVAAETEHGKTVTLNFIKEDTMSDLMLLSGDDAFGYIDVAKKTQLHEHVHAITHGGLAPSYRTDGELLDETKGGFMIDVVLTAKQAAECEATPKYSVVQDLFLAYCVLDVFSSRTTAAIIPGSSGGPLLNERGELIGIASYGSRENATFNWFVRLADIRNFLAQF